MAEDLATHRAFYDGAGRRNQPRCTMADKYQSMAVGGSFRHPMPSCSKENSENYWATNPIQITLAKVRSNAVVPGMLAG